VLWVVGWLGVVRFAFGPIWLGSFTFCSGSAGLFSLLVPLERPRTTILKAALGWQLQLSATVCGTGSLGEGSDVDVDVRCGLRHVQRDISVPRHLTSRDPKMQTIETPAIRRES